MKWRFNPKFPDSPLGCPPKDQVFMRFRPNGRLLQMWTIPKATDGEERLAGQVTLGTQAPRRASETPDRRIQADIGGDITALLAPRYREFFGEDVRLAVDALLAASFSSSDHARTRPL